jgi:predicted RNA-binding protein with PUA-like domain
VKPTTPAHAIAHWLVKSEPDAYSWSDLVREKRTIWSGVRNFAARNHLKAMHRGDPVLFYESVSTKAIVGLASVTRTAFPDETADEAGWVAVEIAAVEPLQHPVTLDRIKSERALVQMALVRIGRLSVQPVTAAEFARVLELGRNG